VSGFCRFPGLSIVAGFVYALLAIQPALPETDLSATEKEDAASESNAVRESNAIRKDIDGVLATLASVAMKEKISRFAGVGDAARKLDSFETEVSIADGVERYTGVRGHHRTYRHISEIGGLWSFGEVVTMLRATRDLIDSSTTNRDWREAGIPPEHASGREEASDVRVIQFQGASVDHKWFVTAHGRIRWLDFTGTIRISRRTGEIERLTWTSVPELAGTDIAGILWDVTFSSVTIAGNVINMPSDSIYRVVRKGHAQMAEWNLTEYTALGRYGSTANVWFGQ
jgi:hypothetical protein